jgi:hypothetical protein
MEPLEKVCYSTSFPAVKEPTKSEFLIASGRRSCSPEVCFSILLRNTLFSNYEVLNENHGQHFKDILNQFYTIYGPPQSNDTKYFILPTLQFDWNDDVSQPHAELRIGHYETCIWRPGQQKVKAA